jgi:hypothetical protein
MIQKTFMRIAIMGAKRKNKLGVCPKCLKLKKLTSHHIFPLRFFGRKNNSWKLSLCLECHKDIEKHIPLCTKLTKPEYIELTRKWLLGKPIKIYLP